MKRTTTFASGLGLFSRRARGFVRTASWKGRLGEADVLLRIGALFWVAKEGKPKPRRERGLLGVRTAWVSCG